MKKFFALLLCALTITASSFAQSKFATGGIIELGGQVAFSSTTNVSNGETADKSSSLFSIGPYFGYFIFSGFELGFMPQVSLYSYGDYSSRIMHLFVAPAFNFSGGSNLFPFIEGLVGYSSSSYDDGITTHDYSGISYGARAGIKYAVGNFLFNAGVKYLLITLNPENADKRNGYNELSIAVGITAHLP